MVHISFKIVLVGLGIICLGMLLNSGALAIFGLLVSGFGMLLKPSAYDRMSPEQKRVYEKEQAKIQARRDMGVKESREDDEEDYSAPDVETWRRDMRKHSMFK
jgi:hypothetical protein